MPSVTRVFLATLNAGKIRDFNGAARNFGVTVVTIPGIADVTPPAEDGDTFEQNARIKAEFYSRLLPGEVVLADDSGLTVEALGGAPGVYSARYAAVAHGRHASQNSDDQENNRTLMERVKDVPLAQRKAKFVCVIAAARDGKTLETFYGEVAGELLSELRGTGGFGYDPLFFFPALGKTFAELTPEEKARYSHRGRAFEKFLQWLKMSMQDQTIRNELR